MQDRVLFPRWSPDFLYGYGFPLFNFYPPVSFYPAAFGALLFPNNILFFSKLTFAMSLLLAAVGAYVFARVVLLNRGTALLAGTLYLYAPLTLGEVYVRSSLAGTAALGLLPFVTASFIQLFRKSSLGWAGISSLLLALMVLTHNITALLALGTVVILVGLHCWRCKQWKPILLSALAIVVALGLTSFYWIPALGEQALTHSEDLSQGSQDYRFHFVDPIGNAEGELQHRYGYEPYLITNWGPFDLHPAYPYGFPPYKLSLLQGVLAVLTGAIWARRRNITPWVRNICMLGLLLFFMHTSWSRMIWERVPLLPLLQFPWRFLGPLGLYVAISGAWCLTSIASSLGRRLSLSLSRRRGDGLRGVDAPYPASAF